MPALGRRNHRNSRVAGAIVAWIATVATSAFAQIRVDERLPVYQPVRGVAGIVNSVGSDTMNNLMALWAEGFRSHYPNVRIEIEGKGSSTAPPALIAGTANFGPMSREMKPAEIDEFVRKFGYKPTALKASIDMLAVYAHRDNPITGLSFSEIDAIFSRHRRRGKLDDARVWGNVGLSGKWGSMPISMYGRNAASGTYTYFKETALANGDFKDNVKELPGSSSVIQGIANDRSGIGYAGIGYKTADVKALAVAAKGGTAPVPPSAENGRSKKYPLSRFLLIYINANPNDPLDPMRREFIRYVFSRQGQETVIKDGYLPVDLELANEALRSVRIPPTP